MKSTNEKKSGKNMKKNRIKVVAARDRDTGHMVILPDGMPAVRNSSGEHLLEFTGTKAEVARKIRQIERNPRLAQKYEIL